MSDSSANPEQVLTRLAREGAQDEVTRACGNPDVLADSLENLADRALELNHTGRHEILADLGRAMVRVDPELHPVLFLEKAGSRSIRKNLVGAVEGLPLDAIADLVVTHYNRMRGNYKHLVEILNRTEAWRTQRGGALGCVQQSLREAGVGAEESEDLLDHLTWSELPGSRRLELLYKGETLWRVDFSRVREVLVRLLTGGDLKEASALARKYFTGLESEDLRIRRDVADNGRYLLQQIERTGKGRAVLGHVADLFFSRLQDEEDDAVVARLAAGLAFLTDLWLRSGELGAALDLMRKAEQLTGSPAQTLRERGERLGGSLSRAGSDKMFGSLTRKLLEESDDSSMEAAEILKRGGRRSATYLIERLAEEENRTHRAKLVMLLKEMGRGSSETFLSRLDDPRWYLVRNVVGILGDIGDTEVLPRLQKIARHPDPRVRREVVRTLMRFGTPACEEPIQAAVRDEDRGVQITAVSALAAMKNQRTAGILRDIAAGAGAFEGLPAEVRREAIACLGQAGTERAIPVLASILTRKGFLGRSEPAELRVAAAKALAAIDTPPARELLEQVAREDPRQVVREAARSGSRR